MREMPRDMLERVARIVGPQSAAARALQEGDSHDGPVRFFIKGDTFVVEKLSKEKT